MDEKKSESIQTHAKWINGSFSKTLDGIVKFENGAFTFTDLSGSELVKLKVDEIKQFSVATKVPTLHIIPKVKRPDGLYFTVYNSGGGSDVIKMAIWEKAFKNSGVKVFNRKLSSLIVALVALMLLGIVIAMKWSR